MRVLVRLTRLYGEVDVDDLPILVDGSVDVAPDAVDLDVCLVDEPPVTRCVAGEPGGIGQQRREPLYPSEDRDVVHLDTAFEQQLLDVGVGQVVPQVPRIATTIRSRGNRNPAKADLGGD